MSPISHFAGNGVKHAGVQAEGHEPGNTSKNTAGFSRSRKIVPALA